MLGSLDSKYYFHLSQAWVFLEMQAPLFCTLLPISFRASYGAFQRIYIFSQSSVKDSTLMNSPTHWNIFVTPECFHGHSWHVQSGTKFQSHDEYVPSWGWKRQLFWLLVLVLLLYTSVLFVFCFLFSVIFFTFLFFLLVISLFKIVPQV